MKIHVKVIGHEIVHKKHADLVKVKLEGVDNSDFKATLLVEEDQRVRYPFGAGAVVDFDIQQRLPLEK
jgi:hypothetical protein